MNKAISMLLLFLITVSGNLFAQNSKMQSDKILIAENTLIAGNKIAENKKNTMMPDMSAWPELQRNAAEEIIRNYGNPDSITSFGLIWMNKGDWTKIIVRIPLIKMVAKTALH